MVSSNPTISGAPNGHNGLFSVRNYGTRTVMITDIQYVVQVGSSESTAAHSHTFYPLNEYVPSFDISLVFKTYSEREDLNRWLRTYMERVSSNQSIGGYVYVYCPVRNFVRDGVLLGNLIYGDSNPNDPAFPVTYRFTGARDPISVVGGTTGMGDVSKFLVAKNDAQNAPFFYPGGFQKAGQESLQGTLYDPAPPPVVIPKPTPPPPFRNPVRGPGGGFAPR